MTESAPVVYLLHGEDEYAITQFTGSLVAKLGDSAMAEMNTTRLDGRSTSLEVLENAISTLPFLVKRRLVILTNPLARLSTPTTRTKFTKLLEKAPSAVAVVLIEHRQLTDERDRKSGKVHWLERWAQAAGNRVLLKMFPLPLGQAMIRRVQELTRAAGGFITPQAAEVLASLVGENPRLADQEIQKLLTYCNYRRPIDVEDVETLVADQGQVDVFAMVDAIGNRDGKSAVNMLHRLLAAQDALSIFGMVVRQFRMLLIVREVIETGGQLKDAARILKLPNFVVEKKLSVQAKKFDTATLESIYRLLLEIDEAAKNGEMEASLALDTLIAKITQ